MAHPVRLVFVGEHAIRLVARVTKSGTVTPQRLNLASARHSRLGDVTQTVAPAGGAMTTLVAGDAVALSFTAPASSAGQIREWALFVRGMRVTPPGMTRARQEHGVEGTPTSFALYQNQPNPFASATTFRFDLPRAETVRLEVFDLVGRRVATVRNAWTPAGRHSMNWNSRDANGVSLRPGAYLYRITAGSFRDQRKLVVLP